MKNTFVCLALFLALSAHAQRPYAKMVVGLETGWDLLLYDTGKKPFAVPNVNVEYPYGNFSFGFGLAFKGYGRSQYAFYDGEYHKIVLPALPSGSPKTAYDIPGSSFRQQAPEQPRVQYVMENREISANYWSVPLHVSYRFLPCKCIYLYGALSFDFLSPSTRITTMSQTAVIERPAERRTEDSFFKKNLRTYELGLGFKLHTSDYFRLVARPSLVWSENPETQGTAMIRSLRMTFGMQYAFVRYGGKR